MPTQENEFNQYVDTYNTARNDTVSTNHFNIGVNNEQTPYCYCSYHKKILRHNYNL